jgi:two-component system, NtrC family, sensor histidine kinase HydH
VLPEQALKEELPDSRERTESMSNTTERQISIPAKDDYRQQKTAFCVLSLFVFALLLVLHTLFASILGEPSIWLILLLGVGFLFKAVELMWLQGLSSELTERTARLETATSIATMFVLTAFLAYLTNRDDSPYFVLLAIPILQCAYICGLMATVLTITAADAMILFWLWHFYLLHPPARATEYLEAGMISVIYMLMGLIVWFLVNQLKSNQAKLSTSLVQLHVTQERLLVEEKLAAVGRLASGIAHEIRNPVAMITSALSTAAHPSTAGEERQEMFAIAARESERLEHLTADFLTYARPSVPQPSAVYLNELLSYIADVTRMHAAKCSITVTFDVSAELPAQVDASLVEGALLNLTLNAIDATPENGTIALTAKAHENILYIDVQNSGPAILASDLERIFEPFFTTKPTGTGLGLAIVRGIARAHGGDVWVSSNEDGRVTFSMTLANTSGNAVQMGAANG